MAKFSSKNTALVGAFAALHAILYVMSPLELWRNWSIYLEPLEGIILGPWVGFLSSLIGSIVARTIKPIDLWMFGIIAEPMGVLACGFMVKKQWKPLMMIYAVMLASYFTHPLGRELPLWAVLDILLAFILIYPVAKMSKSMSEEDARFSPLTIILISFIGTVTDALTRVFLLIPAGLYTLFWTPEDVYYIFVAGALDSYIEDALVIAVSFLVGVPLLGVLRKIPDFKYPLS